VLDPIDGGIINYKQGRARSGYPGGARPLSDFQAIDLTIATHCLPAAQVLMDDIDWVRP